MTKVDFYTGSTDKLRTACQLSHKAIQNNLRVLLYTPDEATTDALDKLLWHYPSTAFIPHCRSHEVSGSDNHQSESSNEPWSGLSNCPVALGHQEMNFPHSELLISLHTACFPFFSRFDRVIEIVGLDADEVRLGRDRYGFYRSQGCELRHFDLLKRGD